MKEEAPVFPYPVMPYQKKIFNFASHSVGNAVISARAGCGKTTVLIHLARLVPKNLKCIFIAFNKSIVEELTHKLEGVKNVSIRTAHGLGLAMIKRNVDLPIEIDEYKYRTYVKTHIEELASRVFTQPKTININLINNVIRVIDYARFNMAQSAAEIYAVAQKYDVPLNIEECAIVAECLEWGSENIQTIDYTDMLWLPIERGMVPRGLQYDWIFHDECQDASLVMQALISKCIKRGTRYIAVGDPYQSIYAFAGADENSFETMCSRPNTQLFELPVSFRCPKSVITFANNIVDDIKAKDDAIEGRVIEECRTNILKEDDMVLARTKSPLVTLYTKLLEKGIPCYIKGSDIGLNLIQLLEAIPFSDLNPDIYHNGVFLQLFQNLFDLRDKYMELHNVDFRDATLSIPVMDFYDNIQTLLILSQHINTKEELRTLITNIFKEEGKGICLSTIHKAKGLEADNVYILCHSDMPSSLARKDWQLQQEENLRYVAYTRAKNTLGFISEEEIPPSHNVNANTFVRMLEGLERRMCDTLGVPFDEDKKFRKPKKMETLTSVNQANVINNVSNTPQSDDDLLQELENLYWSNH